MWVLCCGMHRSGSTLQYQIAAKVAEFHPKFDLIGWVSPAEAEEVFGSASDSPNELHIAKLHDYDQAVDDFWGKFHPKAIYIYRDVRDVIVSTMNMQGWAFDSVETVSRLYSILLNDRLWTQKPSILVSRYEEVMVEGGLLAEVEKIAQYIEVALTPAQVEQIASAVSIKENKRFIEQFDYENKGVQHPNTRFDPQSLFHNNHIRSGASEQWQTTLTPEQIATIEVLAGDWLQDRGYSLDQPHNDQEKIDTLRRMLETVLPKASHNLEEISGLQAYAKDLELRLAAQNPTSPAPTAPVMDANANTRQLQQQIDVLNAQIEGARNRKLARLMSKLGRPII